MTDPLDVLRTPVAPVDPDPAFARDLRARLERALLDPREDLMTRTLDPARETALAAPATALRLHTVTPYLAVDDAAAAVEFYVAAFGAARRGEPIVMPDGRIGHVEVAVGDSVLMMADEFPELGLLAPRSRGGASQSLRLEVSDPDTVVERAVALGGALEQPVTDSPYGRGGVVVDPAGHRWMVSREVSTARTGDVVYASIWTPDEERATRFYGAALGWAPGGAGLRIAGGQPRPGLLLCYSVPDVDAAVEVVRAAGGTAGEPADRPYGRVVDCVDDQGLPFALHTGDGAAVTVPEYAELRMPDEVRARAFYGTLLGWQFHPGREPGQWYGTVDGVRTRPVTGLSGGHDSARVVPTFAVPDLEAALAAVRAAGGTATPAGDCTDDQGTHFRLR